MKLAIFDSKNITPTYPEYQCIHDKMMANIKDKDELIKMKNIEHTSQDIESNENNNDDVVYNICGTHTIHQQMMNGYDPYVINPSYTQGLQVIMVEDIEVLPTHTSAEYLY
ncbi:hypothetical protein [Rickettsiales endosymbiont of Stachyamoeba lipophora]|uniref:hypothetical protein n=1 Tax=Rickettsiales endosymbiont of Stachyamoeba lipophora TaxID=2486578 RepID=UPI000F652DB4|nr:hypothetical protein [Rickettsiales endosymbiont of Stachyamoeba lipophora]AZL16202.1 hypothetical protein EF513_06635 [Rickettsiales endosymbiont of Stachyamoeba lipophora]